MDFEDIADRMRARKSQQAEAPEETVDVAESYRIRAKMVGVLLRDARVAAARTIDDCARLLRVSAQQIEAWEYGDEVPGLPQLELLAYYLDIPVSHFWSTDTLKLSKEGRASIQPAYIALRTRMIGALLRQAREQVGLSIEELSEATGLPAAKISRVELGELSLPLHELSVVSNAVEKNLNYFLETTSQIGELLQMREMWKHFSNLPADVRDFAADPVNIGFIHIAIMLSQMPTDRLRQVGASILDITM